MSARWAVLALLASPAAGAGAACPEIFADARPPVVSAKLAPDTVPLCYDAFALLYSGLSRTPVYAAERLTRQGIGQARTVDRLEAFHEEGELPERMRSRLDDYVRSGFDRGHMAPAGDMPTPASQAQSFTLANVVPQDRVSNRGLWAAIEESVRRMAVSRGTLFVVTGPIFEGDSIPAVAGRVLVPTRLFKALYDPATGEAGAYLAVNGVDESWQAISLQALKERAGLDAFPGLTPAAKARAMHLPEPRVVSRGRDRSEPSLAAWARAMLARLARHVWRAILHALS